MHGVVHLVLHHLKELSCGWSITIIINRRSVDVCQLLVESSFGEAYLC